ncbi:3-hydroxyacyl-CoA dehydrogenase family protein [Pseudomonas veronii]|jgi:3-hydroxybutyryl-CoA dehydrogenase|uniref:3-hydroxyacyl-CoA dehydrogenase family protein n=1 Tax=Pseudomonas veronii TaxID=76761 RepID=A0A7Y1AD83_PSEVE|nr:3-hydroxyacyl-CoA dehydrogenase family protein [Pseudomonas veronii]NMY13633.1 3-hydroxyacyl-CoA dehydrogenase family protein [Pseudomonas veronii]
MSNLSICVAGCGTMGTGIAIVAARSGFPTVLYDMDAGRLEAARRQMSAFLAKSVARGKLTQDQVDSIMARVTLATQPEQVADCGLVIEAVFEDLQPKGAVFQALDKVCSPTTLFASNTSTLSITEIAAVSGRPDRFVGMHFCLPAQLMKLVEMSPGLNTSEEAFAQAWSICEQMGQRPVKTQDQPGFILNCFLVPFNNDAIRLVEQGVAEPEQIDKAIKAALGYAMGPMELLDLVGLDTQVLLCEALHGITHEPRAACPPLLRKMVAAKRLGRKTQRGFLQYESNKIFGS